MSDDQKAMHRLRGALNGVVLQLEVLALAADRGDAALLAKALAAARGAARDAVDQLEALSSERA
ncbi:MAG: hypothetical protein U1F43_37590 [Myxococcota bacterium]